MALRTAARAAAMRGLARTAASSESGVVHWVSGAARIAPHGATRLFLGSDDRCTKPNFMGNVHCYACQRKSGVLVSLQAATVSCPVPSDGVRPQWNGGAAGPPAPHGFGGGKGKASSPHDGTGGGGGKKGGGPKGGAQQPAGGRPQDVPADPSKGKSKGLGKAGGGQAAPSRRWGGQQGKGRWSTALAGNGQDGFPIAGAPPTDGAPPVAPPQQQRSYLAAATALVDQLDRAAAGEPTEGPAEKAARQRAAKLRHRIRLLEDTAEDDPDDLAILAVCRQQLVQAELPTAAPAGVPRSAADTMLHMVQSLRDLESQLGSLRKQREHSEKSLTYWYEKRGEIAEKIEKSQETVARLQRHIRQQNDQRPGPADGDPPPRAVEVQEERFPDQLVEGDFQAVGGLLHSLWERSTPDASCPQAMQQLEAAWRAMEVLAQTSAAMAASKAQGSRTADTPPPDRAKRRKTEDPADGDAAGASASEDEDDDEAAAQQELFGAGCEDGSEGMSEDGAGAAENEELAYPTDWDGAATIFGAEPEGATQTPPAASQVRGVDPAMLERAIAAAAEIQAGKAQHFQIGSDEEGTRRQEGRKTRYAPYGAAAEPAGALH